MKAELALALAEDAATTEFEKTRWTTEYELRKLFHQSFIDAAKGGIDRARDSAKYIQTASAAIAALYVGALGLVFSVTSNPLPLRGIFTPIFLGLAIFLATFYLSFIRHQKGNVELDYGVGAGEENQLKRLDALVRMFNAVVARRSWALQASVLSLACGLIFIAAPFVSGPRAQIVPSPPTPPVIPSAIDSAVRDRSIALFDSQAETFVTANRARNEAIEKASRSAEVYREQEQELNSYAAGVAVVSFAMVIVVPVVWSRRHGSRT